MKTYTHEDLPCLYEKSGEAPSDHFGAGVKEKIRKCLGLEMSRFGKDDTLNETKKETVWMTV